MLDSQPSELCLAVGAGLVTPLWRTLVGWGRLGGCCGPSSSGGAGAPQGSDLCPGWRDLLPLPAPSPLLRAEWQWWCTRDLREEHQGAPQCWSLEG